MDSSQVFLRKATGLVREVSWIDVLLFCMIEINIGIGLQEDFLFMPFYPGANMTLATLFVVLGSIPLIIVYALFTATMPRSGGDYVYMSRSIGPVVGFALNWNFVFWEIFYIGWGGGAFGFMGLSSLFSVLGSTLGNPNLTNVAEYVSTPTGYIIVGTLSIIAFGSVLILGSKRYFYVQNVLFILAMGGSLVTIGVLAFSSRDLFIARFNQIASAYTNSTDPYHEMISIGTSQANYTPNLPLNMGQTLNAMVWPFYALAFGWMAAAFAGEIKSAKKSSVIGMPAATLISGVLMLITTVLAINVIGYDFFNTAGLVYSASPESYFLPIAPWISSFVAILTDNVILQIIILVSFALWAVYWVAVCAVYTSRCILAWAFDRMTPKVFGYVSERFRTPVVALVFVLAFGWINLIIYAYVPIWGLLVGILGMCLTLLGACISGVVFPYRRKDIYDKSPVRYQVGGIPLMTICGLLGSIFLIYMIWLYATDPVVMGTAPQYYYSLTAVIVVFFSGIAYFYLMRAYNKRKGINVDLAFKEIPVE